MRIYVYIYICTSVNICSQRFSFHCNFACFLHLVFLATRSSRRHGRFIILNARAIPCRLTKLWERVDNFIGVAATRRCSSGQPMKNRKPLWNTLFGNAHPTARAAQPTDRARGWEKERDSDRAQDVSSTLRRLISTSLDNPIFLYYCNFDLTSMHFLRVNVSHLLTVVATHTNWRKSRE